MYDDFISFLQYPGYAYGDKHKQALVVKALPKNTGDVKPKSAPTVRAARKTLGAGGRVRYTYANERGGVKPKKAVGSASVANNTQAGVTPTEQKADPAKFCELLGIRRDVLTHVVKRSKTQDDFVNYMLLNLKKLNTKYTLTGDFYRRLYDSLA